MVTAEYNQVLLTQMYVNDMGKGAVPYRKLAITRTAGNLDPLYHWPQFIFCLLITVFTARRRYA